ncbi:MAG: polysaccharide lyase [Nitrosomonas sp.]|nr:MAG: polysaccharide lyase [Nitrosomonas sp.]
MEIESSALLSNNVLVGTDKVPQLNRSGSNRKTRNAFCRKLFVAACFIGATITAPVTQAANLLFKSNYGAGVALGPVYGFTENYAWQDIIGTDKETGYSWPIKAFGAKYSGIHLWAYETIDSTNVNDHIENMIRPVAGPDGATVNELFQSVKIKGPVGVAKALASLQVIRHWNIGDVNEAYITYWYKYEADFPDKLDSSISAGNWRSQFGWKTGGYENTYAGDYRFFLNVIKGKDGKLFWRIGGDNVANGPWDRVIDWTEDNKIVPVPVDKWFKFEVYWKRSGGSDGRFWAAVDGQEIVDRHGPNMGDYNLPVTRITINTPYSGGYATVESHSTKLEIWDGFPCGDGVSCYHSDADIAAPTAPNSLTGDLSINTKTKTKFAQTSLSWAAATDNVGVTGYKIFRNRQEIFTTTTTNYVDKISGNPTGGLYTYSVKAIDAAGNVSSDSNQVSVVY